MNRVVVVGAGVGGIACAVQLARSGYQVTVLEKNAEAGGRCGHLEADGFRFDTGATMFLMPDLYDLAFRELGERVEDHLDLVRVDPSYRLNFGDGTHLELTSDLDRMRAQLETMEPGSFSRYVQYLDEGARHYRLAVPLFVTKECRSLPGLLAPANLIAFARMHALSDHFARAGKYFQDERLRAAFTFQDMYMGLSPFLAPATYSLVQYAEFARGVWSPKGGMYSLVRALVGIAEDRGVDFEYDAPVARIDVEGDRATGVTLAGGRRIPADIVVANADLVHVYRNLLPHDRTAARLERKRFSTSMVTFLWGVDRQYPELATHNLSFGRDIRGGSGPVFDGRGLPPDPHFYVHAPARTDPSMAPPGCDALVVDIPSAHVDEQRPQDWERIADDARAAVLTRLEGLGLEGLRRHIVFERRFTPVDWSRRCNLVKGATHGLGHDLGQMGYLRPHNRHARFRNLYFVGASTHPGTGLPNVLLSAAFASRRIREEDRVRPAANRLGAPLPERGGPAPDRMEELGGALA